MNPRMIRQLQQQSNRLARTFTASPSFRGLSIGFPFLALAVMLLALVCNPLQRGLTGTYYHLAKWSGDPIFTVTDRYCTIWRMTGEPAEIDPTYSIEWSGYIFIPTTGEYRFSTLSDDGSQLWIDERQIVDNSGIHVPQEREGKVFLEQGFHAIRIRYMQWGGGAWFRAYWTPPGKGKEELSHASLFVIRPTFEEFRTGRILEFIFTTGLYLLALYLVLTLLVWLTSGHILRPFFRDAWLGKFYRKCSLVIIKPESRKRAYPAPPQAFPLSYSLFALLGYTILSLLWTYPLILNFSSKMFGLGGDRYIYLWNMWWLKKALFELHTTPLFTEYLFYPKGISLAFHDFSLLNALFSLPLQPFLSLQEIYNLLFLSSFILGGFGCFLLVRYFTGDQLAAFLSGIVFAFWGGRMYYVDHLSLASIQWLPFCVLYLFKTLRESSFGARTSCPPPICGQGVRAPKYRNAIFAALFLVFNALSAWYYAVYMLLFVLLFVLYAFAAERQKFLTWACLKRFGLIAILSMLIMLPVAVPMLSDILAGQKYMVSDLLSAESASPNVLFFPSVNHGIVGKYVRYVYERYGLEQQVSLSGAVFIGYTVLALCLYAVFKLWHLRLKFWLIALVIFLILSLGPHLQLFYEEYTWIPLPYQLLQKIPILNIVRVPVRFIVMVMLCCSVLVGYACWDIFRRIRNRKTVFAILVCLMLFEFVRFYYITPVEQTPEFYVQCGEQDENYAILEITRPMNWSYSSTRSSLFQITHEKKLFHGHVSRVSRDTYYQAYSLYTVFDDLFTLPDQHFSSSSGAELSFMADRDAFFALLSFYDVRYVALYYDYWTGTFKQNRKRLERIFGEPLEPSYGGMEFFEVPRTPLEHNLVFPGFGMLPLQFYEGSKTFRQTATIAEIKMLNVEKLPEMQLRFEGESYRLPQEKVEISLNGTLLTTVKISDWTDVIIPAAPIQPGENTIRLHTVNNGDEKYGIYVRNLSVEFLE